MSKTTNIQWATHTGSPWFGCSPVSPGCANCYAWELAESRLAPIIRGAYRKAGLEDWETRAVWGDKAPRVLCKGFWKDARRYNTSAAGTLKELAGTDGGASISTGASRESRESESAPLPPLPPVQNRSAGRPRMFPSMDDWLDEMPAGIIDQEGNWLEPVEVLANFLRLIYETPNLDWLLLTKRAEQCRQRLEAVLDIKEEMGEGIMGWPLMVAGWLGLYGIVVEPPDNVWFGVSVENQETAEERIPELLKIPARVRFLSVEPLLGPVVFDYCDEPGANHTSDWSAKVLPSGIHWVIVGGESGPKARPCKVEWVRDIVRQCKAADVPCFVKQLGSDPLSDDARDKCLVEIRDRKGGEPGEWPEDLRIREMPLNR